MIRVPLLNSAGGDKKYVEVVATELPAQASTMITLLTREQASIEYWLEISVSAAKMALLLTK